MAVKAFVLIDVKAGTLNSVLQRILQIEGVKEAYPITGDYDALVSIEVDEIDEIHNIMLKQIQKIDGVEKTNTHIAFTYQA